MKFVARIRTVIDCSAKLGHRRDVADGVRAADQSIKAVPAPA